MQSFPAKTNISFWKSMYLLYQFFDDIYFVLAQNEEIQIVKGKQYTDLSAKHFRKYPYKIFSNRKYINLDDICT